MPKEGNVKVTKITRRGLIMSQMLSLAQFLFNNKQCTSTIKISKKGVRFAHLNCRRICNKFELIQHHV